MFESDSQSDENSTALKESPQPQPADVSNASPYVADMAYAEEPHESVLKKVKNFRVEFGPSRKDILNFTNQLAVMIRAAERKSEIQRNHF